MAVAILLAAGAGERLGADVPKAFVILAGRPLWQWSMDVLRQSRSIEEVVLALPPNAPKVDGRFKTVSGGTSRSESVANAMAEIGTANEIVIHDAARPFITSELVESTVAALSEADAAIAAIPVTDTIKQVDSAGTVTATLDRSQLWAIQTPQAFRRKALERGLEAFKDSLSSATDDAWLVEKTGGTVRVVESTTSNYKITTAHDLRVAEEYLTRFRTR